MASVRLGNAPISWGISEFARDDMPPERFVKELKDAGFVGTELGDLGFLPTEEPPLLKLVRDQNGLQMIGAFAGFEFHDRGEKQKKSREYIFKVARLLSAFNRYQNFKPHICLSDAVCDKVRIDNAGRQTQGTLNDEDWKKMCEECDYLKSAVESKFGIACAFHPHGGSHVETIEEQERFVRDCTVNLVFDTGHFYLGNAYKTTDPAQASKAMIDFIKKYKSRIHTFHFKDFKPDAYAQVVSKKGSYFDFVEAGGFCELGDGIVDFEGVKKEMDDMRYNHWVLVEQDILPGMKGSPFDSAKRAFAFLTKLFGVQARL